MTKRVLGIVVAAVMLLGIFALASCEVGLNGYKESAKAELQSYADAQMAEHTYSAEGLAAIAQAVADGKAEIEGAQDKLAVTAAINKAKKEIHMVNYEGRDFLLTISVENTTVMKDENFRGFETFVELKNQSGRDVEIGFNRIFYCHIPGWQSNEEMNDMPAFQQVLFQNGYVIRRGNPHWADSPLTGEPYWTGETPGIFWAGEWNLKKGTHELRFEAKFSIIDEQGNSQSMTISSNTIILTVK
ncbi:MAG: hypothetical protein FWH03_03295 [Firmicutes bacterium]|nr:hypothetical protein [Bacillota bacterium]